MYNYNSDGTKSCVEKFKRMLKTNTNYYFDPQEFEEIIVHYLSHGDKQLAKRALRMGLEQHPSFHGLLLLQSEVYILEENYEVAIKLLEYIEKLNPFDEEIALQRANIASKKGDHIGSINYLHKALKFSDDPDEIWTLLGMEHLLVENYSEASYFFKNCLSNNPEDYPSLYNLLHCYDQLNMTEAAIDSLNKVLESDPYCEVAWHQLGKVYLKCGKSKEALSAFEFAIISDDRFTGAYIEKGKLLESLGRLNEAILNYELALKTTESNAFIHNSIGRCHQNLGNFDAAETFYFESVELEPTNERCWESLIIFLISRNKFEKARVNLEKSLAINDDSIELWKNNAELCLKIRNKNDAFRACQKLISLGYYESDIIFKIIDFLIKNRDWKKAHSIAENAYSFCPNNRNLEIRIAGCCLNLNKIDEGLLILNLQQLNNKEKNLFLYLFPGLNNLLAKA